MWRSSFLVNLQACWFIHGNLTNKWIFWIFFDSVLSPPMLPPCIDSSLPHQILKSPTSIGGHSPPCSLHLWQTLSQPSSLFGISFCNNSNCHATKMVIWLFGCNSSVHWSIPEKLQTGWMVDIVFWNPPAGIFRFVTLTLETIGKTSFHPWKFWKIMWNWKFQGQKPRPKKISH